MNNQPVSPQTPSQSSSTPFYLACVTLVVCSAAVVTVTRSSGLGALGFLAGVALAMFFLVLPSWLEHRAAGLDQLHLALAEIRSGANTGGPWRARRSSRRRPRSWRESFGSRPAGWPSCSGCRRS